MLSFLSLFIMTSLFAQKHKGIQFEHYAWTTVLKKAKIEKKLIFVDAFATWCGPCKYMSKNIFTNESVGKFYNENFINFKIDMETKAGQEFNAIYTIESYPSLMFIDSDGNIVKKQEGASSTPEGFIQLGDYVLHPEKSPIFVGEKKYKAGNRDRKFLVEYLILLASNNEDPQFVMEEYNNLYKPTSLQIDEDLFMYCINPENCDFNNYLTKDFIQNSKQYAQNEYLLQYDLFTEKIKEILQFNLTKAIDNKDKVLLEKVISFFKSSFKDSLEENELKTAEKEFRTLYKDLAKS